MGFTSPGVLRVCELKVWDFCLCEGALAVDGFSVCGRAYWWPNMAVDFARYVRNRHHCSTTNSKREKYQGVLGLYSWIYTIHRWVSPLVDIDELFTIDRRNEQCTIFSGDEAVIQIKLG